mmetsp:Transcript_48456/g.151959  ORF Transcript_48456/g.151959 Transcript_48456/m.151959 type:complete len:311 (-) Transcript_48456:51-983(-)
MKIPEIVKSFKDEPDRNFVTLELRNDEGSFFATIPLSMTNSNLYLYSNENSDVAQSDYIGIPQRYTNEAYVQSRKQMQRENEYEDGGQRNANNPQDENSAPLTLGEVCIILMESVQYVELQGMNFQNALFNDIMKAFNFMNFELELLECENGREPFTIKCRLAMKSLLQMEAEFETTIRRLRMKKEEVSNTLKQLPVTRRAIFFSLEFTTGDKILFMDSDGSSDENNFSSGSSPGHSLLNLLSQLKKVNMSSNGASDELYRDSQSVNSSINQGIENEIRKTFEETSQVKHETEKMKGRSLNPEESLTFMT